jgi:hypothetical protein
LDPSTLSLWRCSGTSTLSFPFPAGPGPPGLGPLGPWLARCWRSGEAPGMWIPRLGSPLSCRTARPPSSRVGIDARTVNRNAWSSHRALIPLGRTRDSRLNASPVIARNAVSSSTLEKLVPGPRAILQQSFVPVYMQAILVCCCRGAIRRFRKSPSTIRDVRPLLERFLTRSRTGPSSSGGDGLAFQVLRSLWGPSVGSSRR